jgi:hypothetical protein
MKLIDHVIKIRYKIERAFDNRFSRMGFKPENVEAIADADEENAARRRHIGDIISIHQNAGKDYKDARKEALSECVFTLYNRLAAIKVMECKGKELVPEVLRTRATTGNLSFMHNAWLEEHPEERNAERMGLKHFIRDEFKALSERIPIFREDYPYDLLPTADELHDIIAAFNAIDDDPDLGPETWKGDDILGWQYENFNTAEKIALKQSGDKTEYDKVSLQSQVYTPRWTVKFLVDNSLGRLYLEMYPDSTFFLNEDGTTKYLIANAPKKQMRTPKPLTELRVIDPACGSGNFLIYAFIILYDMYIDQIENYRADYNRRDIPKLIIENNLYGVDLDERAVQISQIALLIKAWEVGGKRGHMPEHINIVSSHFTLPAYSEVEGAFVKDNCWDEAQKKAVESIWNDLRNAYKFGTLVRVEEKLKELRPNFEEQNLFFGLDKDDVDFRTDVAATLKEQVRLVADNSKDDYASRQVRNALTFLNIISNEYDVAVANPPYTDSADFGPELKAFINENYAKPYKVNVNLYATFIKRCFDLTDCDGKIAMIHPMTFMYIKTFEGTRKLILEKSHINLFVEYGLSNLFGSIMVDPAFYVLDKGTSSSGSTFISLDQYTRTPQEKFKKNYCLQALADIVEGQSNQHVYSVQQSKLKEIKSWPFIYWISDEFREKFAGDSADQYMDIVKGLTTSNNERFLRFWWEIPSEEISKDYTSDHCKWVPYVKGGPFKRWYGNMWTLLNWGNDGYEIKHFVDDKGKIKSRPQNVAFYFREGVTYSAAGSKGASFRYLPKNYVIDAGGPGIYPNKYTNIPYILAFFNSVLSFYICDCLNPTVNINQGDLWRVPFVLPNKDEENEVTNLSKSNVDIKRSISQYSLIEQNFIGSPIRSGAEVSSSIFDFYCHENALNTMVVLHEAIIDELIFHIYELNDHDIMMVLDKAIIKNRYPSGLFSVSSSAKQAYIAWLTSDDNEFKPTQELVDHIHNLEENDNQPKIDDFDTLYQNNNGWEEFCIKHKMNPIEVWWQFKNAKVLPPQRTQVLAFELITDVMRTVLNNDDDGIIPLGTRIGEDQMSHRIEQELQRRGYTNSQISQIVVQLGSKDLDTYLRDHFFQQLSDHLNLFMYLPKTPFIWHLTSGPLHALDVMVSIYKWNRNTLSRIKSVYAARRETQLNDAISQYADSDDGSTKMAVSIIRELKKELEGFVDKIDDLLASGYDPKLDDGVGKNIAPLQKRGMLSYNVLNAGQLKKYLNADW